MPSTLDAWPSHEGLRVGYLNINSARNKTDDISTILCNKGNSFHVFCFAESRLTSTIPDSEVYMPNYDTIRLDPVSFRATGLLLYCASSLTYRRLTHLENCNIECIWL